MVIWILNFGDGFLAVNYLIFCTIASLGTLQFIAGRTRLIGFLLLPQKLSMWIGAILVVGAFVWFFTIQPDLFIPGLAGGEFFALFFGGFLVALFASILFGIVANQVIRRLLLHSPPRRESVSLGGGKKGELWLPEEENAPLVIVLRETATDAMDILASEIVASGAAALLCNADAVDDAHRFVNGGEELFHPTRRYAVGLGRGADQVLRLASDGEQYQAVLALAPFGSEENARPGLRWLQETDYLTALAVTWNGGKLTYREAPPTACVVYGDEDALIPPSLARRMYPSALMVAGARHFTLGRTPATKRLALDLFQLRPTEVVAPEGATTSPLPSPGGVAE